MITPAKVLDKAALGLEGLRRFGADPLGGAHMDGQQITAVDAAEDAGAPADQGFAVRTARQPDDDPLTGRPAGFDAVAGPVPGQAFVHPVRQPEQGQFAQCGEVARPVVVREGGVDPVCRDDPAVREPLAQQLGGDVHELDLCGLPGNLIRHGLLGPDVGDGADDVAEGSEMLDVEGG